MHEFEKEEEHCEVCNTYENYLFLQKQGYGEEESFHEAVSYMAGELIETLVDDLSEEFMEHGYSIGFDDGIVDAMRSISEQASNVADLVEEQSSHECACDEDVDVTYVDVERGIDCGCVDGCFFDDSAEMSDEGLSDEEKLEKWLNRKL